VGEGESSEGGHAENPKGLADPQGLQRPKALIIAAAAQGRVYPTTSCGRTSALRYSRLKNQ